LTKKKQKVKTKRSALRLPACSAFCQAGARFSNYVGYLNQGRASTNGANRKFSEPSRAACAPRKALGWRSWWLFEYFFAAEKSVE